MFITNLDIDEQNVSSIVQSGRARWQIETRRKTLHHKFNRNDLSAIKNWHNTRQLAYTIKEFIKYSCELQQLKKDNSKMTWKEL